MKVILGQPRGFCAGVNRAIAVVETALKKYGAPVYVRHEIVHNRTVVESLRKKGAVFTDDLNEVPCGSIIVFSAHGVSKSVEEKARSRNLKIIDATCPLVMKVHREVKIMHDEGRFIIMIGHKGHAEVEGTMGQIDGGIVRVDSVQDVESLNFPAGTALGYVTQTTLSADETRIIISRIKSRWPGIRSLAPADICYATQSRQHAVSKLSGEVDLFLIIGSQTSSNSNRLRDKAQASGVEAHLIDSYQDISLAWLDGKQCVGVTAGASAPEHLVQEVVAFLRDHGAVSVETMPGEQDRIKFPLPARI